MAEKDNARGRVRPSGKQSDARGSESQARTLAARVLERVLYRDGFAAAELDHELSAAPDLDPRDRALATELVYGVLRTHPALEQRLQDHAKEDLRRGDRTVRVQLLLAAYQILLLTRVPAFAAVNEAVNVVARARGRHVGGFVNAVLRKVSAGEPLSAKTALLESAPAWLRENLVASVGEAAALGLLGADRHLGVAPTGVRWEGQGARPDWTSEAEPGTVLPVALRFRGRGDVRRYPEFAAGQFVVQEEGAQLAGYALGARAGERVLDACAGRGQKSSLLARQVGATGWLLATDLSAKKLAALAAEFTRLHLPPANTATVDWRQGSADVPTDFQRALVDAPCSGTGTLRHRPEIALRLQPDDVERLATLSEAILRQVSAHVESGGRVVFVVCSVLERECEQVVERVADVLEPVPFDAPEVTALVGPASSTVRLLPSEHETDGFFVASLRRR